MQQTKGKKRAKGGGRKGPVVAKTAEQIVNAQSEGYCRPILDLKLIESLCAFAPTERELAAHLGIPWSSWSNYKNEFPELKEAIETGRAKGALSIRKWQFDSARKGNPAMLIWLGKNRLGQRDTPEDVGPKPTEIVYRWATPQPEAPAEPQSE